MTVRLRDLARVDSRSVAPADIDYSIPFVGLESIGRSGHLDERTRADPGSIKSAKVAFDSRHILYGKLRPNLGKVARPTSSGIASTDIYPLLPNEDVDRGYLAWYLLHPKTIAWAASRTSGVNLPRINWSVLGDLEVPLPPLPEQHRIAAILDHADALRIKRRQTIESLGSFGDAAFEASFSVPRSRLELDALPRLSEHAELITDGEHQTPNRSAHGHRLLSARNIRNGRIDTTDVDYVDGDEFRRIARRCSTRRGDVLISCSGTVGRVAAVTTDEPFVMVRSVALVRPSTTLRPLYLERYLRSVPIQRAIQRVARSSAQSNLFQQPIRGLPVLVPPISAQLDFESTLESILSVGDAQRRDRDELDALFTSLQHRAFRGEL